jgi:branched-chain amino acid transport system substrate-binding protein
MYLILKKSIVPVLLVGLFNIAPLQAAERGVSSKEIIIGQTISSGPNASAYATAASLGIKLYLDKTNVDGGVGGRRIVLRVLDDAAKADTAYTNALKLVNEGAFVLFAPLEGGPSTAVAKAAEETNTILFSPMAGSPTLTQPHRPLVFPVRAMHKTEFRKLTDYASVSGLTRGAFFHAKTAVGASHLKNVKEEASRANVTIVSELPYTDDITDEGIDTLIAKAKKDNVQFIINHGSPGIYKRLVSRSKHQGFNPSFLGVNSGSSEIAKQLGNAASGIIFSQVTPNPSGGKFAVVREYESAWKKAHPNLVPSHGALEGYISAKALVLALKRASPHLTSQTFTKALYSAPIELGGMDLVYTPEKHSGLSYVDLSTVRTDGTFAY